MTKPLISVITVTFNMEASIERTIKSVLAQSFTNFEYIIIDGKSTDKTVEIEQKYKDKLAYFVSEKDTGMYEAMNKATAKAKGEWVCYMQGDDIFKSKDSLAEVAKYLEKTNADIVYGDATMLMEYGIISTRNGQSIENMHKTLPFSHQASFVRTKLAQQHPFNTQYKICADYDFFYKLYANNYKFEYMPVTVAVFSSGGKSDKQRIKGLKEVLKIKQTYDTNQMHILSHRFHITKTAIRLWLKNLLPEKLVSWYFHNREQKKYNTKIILLGPGESGGIGQYIHDIIKHYPTRNISFIRTHYKKQYTLLNFVYYYIAQLRLLSELIKKLVTKKKIVLHINMAVGGSFVRKLKLMQLFSKFVNGIVLHIHGAETKKFFEKMILEKNGKAKIIECLRLPNEIIFVSNNSKNEILNLLKQENIPFDEKKIIVLHNSVSLPKVFPIPQVFDKNKTLQIVTISRLEPQKNIFLLPEISKVLMEKGIKNHFHIIGAGTLHDQFKKISPSNFTLYGMVPNDKIDDILQKCNLFILASKAESFGIVVLEAYRNGLPVVTSNVGGLNDIVIEGVTGYKCDPDKAQEFADRIESIIKNPKLFSELQKNVQKEVQKYSIEEHVQKLKVIYDSLL